MMKIVNMLVALVASLMASAAMASTVFMPQLNPVDNTYEEVDFFYLSIPSGYSLGVFDSADTSFLSPLYVASGEAVSFSPSVPLSGPYTAQNTTSLATLGLGATPAFILGMYDGSAWHADNNTTSWTVDNSAYSVSFETTPGNVLTVDVSTVPVPAAAWLFGSGLLGLVGVARRRRT